MTICHFTGSSSNPYEIISVSGNALSEHQQEHGDFIFTDCCLDSECTAFANSFCDSGACSCAPDTCGDLGVECGVWDDGCGGQAQGCSECTAFPNSFCDADGQCACDALTQDEACAGVFGTVSDGCGATYYCGCAAAVISSSPTDATAPVNRDDDVRVQVNGTTVYNEANGFAGPSQLITLGSVRNGDTINVVAWDPQFGDLWLLDPLYLHCPADGRSQTLDSVGFFQDVDDFQTAPLPNGFYNRNFTVAL